MTESELIRHISDSFEKAKAGDALAVYASIAPIHDRGDLPLRSHYPFGWIIYYALHNSAPADIAPRKEMLLRYLGLKVTRPHKLHSMILTEAIRLYKDARDAAYVHRADRDAATRFSIVRFTALWDTANLRPGDWRRKEFEDKTLGSTVEKLITVCVDELEQTSTPASADFTEVVSRAMAEFPDSFNLAAQRATLHILAGQPTQATSLLRTALLAAPGKFFLWSRLASLVDPAENRRLHVALLYKALRAPGPDKFKGRIRLALARAWAATDAWPQAAWELARVKAIYEANDWHLPKSWTEISDLLPEPTVAADPEPLYKKIEHLADAEIYSALPAVSVVKTYHKAAAPACPGRNGGFDRPTPTAWRVTDSQGQNYWLQPHRFGLAPELPVGTPLTIRLHAGKPVAATLAESK